MAKAKAKKAAASSQEERESEAARLAAMDRRAIVDIFADSERRIEMSRKSGTERGVRLTYGQPGRKMT